jgi:hypothetical protein
MPEMIRTGDVRYALACREDHPQIPQITEGKKIKLAFSLTESVKSA